MSSQTKPATGQSRADAEVTVPAPDFTSLPNPARDIHITPGTIAAIFFAALGLILFLAALRDLISIILLVLLAITVALGIMPAVDRLERLKLPRVLATLLIYVAVLGGLILLLFFTIRPVANDLQGLAQNAPNFAHQIYDKAPDFLREPLKPLLNATGLLTNTASTPTLTSTLGTITSTTTISTANGLSSTTTVAPSLATGTGGGGSGGLSDFFGPLIAALISVLGGIGTVTIGFVSVLVIAFYWVMLRDQPQRIFLTTIAPSRRAYAADVLNELASKIGGYIRGELILGLIIGGLSFAGLLLLGVKYAVVLAVLAGITELIPTIGPIIGSIPAITVGFATGGFDLGLKVLILYVVIQQLENNLIVPRVMGAAVDLPPLLVLTAVLIWGSLFGLLGAILAVPITAIFTVLFNRIVLPYLQQRAMEAG